MTALVLDASAVVEYLRATPVGLRVAARIEDPAVTRHIPDLCPAEVASALRGLVRGRLVQPRRVEHALEDLVDLDAERYDFETLLPRVWEFRRNLTVYDASYVALAESLGAPLVATDRKFDIPFVRRLITVEVIK